MLQSGARRLEAFSLSFCADRAGDLEAQREAALREHPPYLQLSFFWGESRRAAQADPFRWETRAAASQGSAPRAGGPGAIKAVQEPGSSQAAKKKSSPFQLEPVTPQLTWEHLAQEAEQQLEASSD